MKRVQNEDISTIKLTRKTKQRLDKLRIHKRESYEDILQKTLGILNLCRIDPAEAQEKLLEIEKQARRNLQDPS